MEAIVPRKLLTVLILFIVSLLGVPSSSFAANGGKIKVYYGTVTSYTASQWNLWTNRYDPPVVTADGLGGATPAVTIQGSTFLNGEEYSRSTNGDVTIRVWPDATHKISSIKLIRYRTNNTDSVTNISVGTPPTGETNYTFNLQSGRNYVLLVDYNDNVYQLKYTISADITATPATTCNTTRSITPAALDPAFLTITPGATQSFVIDNTNSACVVDSIDFNNTGWVAIETLNWVSATKTYTPPAINGDRSFKVRYRGITYQVITEVDSTGSSCGSISPATQSYGAGASQTFTVVTPAGCAVESFKDNGVDKTLSASNTYSVTNISENHTLKAKFAVVTVTSGSTYCQVPPFMDGQSVLKPNVMLIFDNSGSMGSTAYYGTSLPSYNTTTTYYGYFENNKMYKSSGNTYSVDDTITLNLNSNASNGKSGNYLNYRYMRRVDVLRKVLVGGKVDPDSGSARGSATGSTYYRYLLTDDGKKVKYGTTDPTGLVHQVADTVRMGIMVFNPNGSSISSSPNQDGARLVAEIGSSRDVLVDNIENSTEPDGWTPLAESVYEGLRYYQGGTSAYNSYDSSASSYTSMVSYGGAATDSLNPHRVYAKPIQGTCQNNYILLLTDGAPTNDKNLPGQTGAKVSDTSFTGWWTTVNGYTLKPANLLGRVGYYAHSFDLANNVATTGQAADMSKLQSVTLFTVFSFGDDNGDTYLQEAARFGGFIEDKTIVGTNKNGKPDIANEYITDSADPTTTRGYFEADDGAVLQTQLTSIFNSILSSTASGTAAAVANNKSGQRGANMIQALFYPQFPTDNTKKWMGEVQALWYYLDPLINYSAIYQDSTVDKVLNLFNDTLLPSDPFETKSLWRAGAKLQTTDAGTRNIYTLIDASKDLTDAANTFVATKAATLKTTAYMNIASLDDTGAGGMIDYLRGVHKDIYRNRTVTFTDPSTSTVTTGVWKLGDIVNSTPIVQSSVPINSYDSTYSDSSYGDFTKTTAYKGRNVVYTGSNGGMLHAFRLGASSTINDASQPFKIARLNGTDLGKEEWAFIPKNAMPYLQHQCGSDYCHQYLVDGSPLVVDASINIPTGCSEAKYWECATKTTASTNYVLDPAGTSWKTVMVASMGLGGASRDKLSDCNETYPKDATASNNTDCVKTPVAGNGLSSYFALDVTDPLVPKHMWEFSDYDIAADTNATAADKGLGFTNPGTAVVRIDTGKDSTQKRKNGRWFAVMASGPTGAIDTSQRYFAGRSDQNLKLYVVDLNARAPFKKCTSAYTAASDCNYWVKDTEIPFAFANSLSGSAIDLDRWSQSKTGNYSDDVVYVTYTKASLTDSYPSSATAWNKGGVLRLVTNNDPDPFNWFTSSLIDDVGPITTSVARIQDRNKKQLWVFFGEGRYFYPGDERTTGSARKFYGVQDPCYDEYVANSDHAMKTTKAACVAVNKSNIQDQSGDTPASTLTTGNTGWSVNMATTSGTSGDERVVSDVTATFNGLVFYTTYTPNTDICTPGGVSSLWAVQYNSGGTPAASAMKGKAPLQTSSGGIKLIDLSTSFTEKGKRKLGASFAPAGMAPKGRFPPLLSPKPSKQILQIREN